MSALPSIDTTSPQALRDAWHALTAQNRLRIRDAAHTLGVSEAQLLATGVGEHVVRLAGDVRDLMMRMGEFGPVMALTRNEAAVHEKDGRYTNISHGDQVGRVKKPTADGVVTSIELFDAQGEFIAYFFGKRKPGIPETTGWRMLAESMETR